jgi:hypothetical protein
MNVFETHSRIISDYENYITSFINISDREISDKVEAALREGKLWPKPLLQFNPAYEQAGTVEAFAQSGVLHTSLPAILKGYSLYHHQISAMRLGTVGKDFVVTSGTGSGKSLTYIGTIFDHLLREPDPTGVTAIIVYPMNALINSQTNEIDTYRKNYEREMHRAFPISFGQYTGQEDEGKREGMRETPPHILLTNYMMLELLLTRVQERRIREAIFRNLKFLVFDELHTYRGRQGADVAMLIRRIQAQCQNRITFIGTSATMVSSGTLISQRQEVAGVATTLFGRNFTAEQVIPERLTRSLAFSGSVPGREELRSAIQSGINPAASEDQLRTHPVAIWMENCVALEEREGEIVRRRPLEISKVVELLSEHSGCPTDVSREALSNLLLWISTVNKQLIDKGSRYTILPFKLHQFIAQTGSVYTTLDQDEKRFITLEPGMYKKDEAEKKPIFPNVFSRATGHPFICVTHCGDRLEPREFRDRSDEDEDVEATDGYLIVGDEIWDPTEDLEYLPDSWLKRSQRKGLYPAPEKAHRFPRRIYFDEFGRCSETGPMKYWGWFMSAPLLFDPTGGVFFDPKTSEGTKLTQLGSEGRSTSTTITAFSVLNRLHDAGYHPKDQKLLSFMDNVQDAALQAGHFNDFVQVVQLRSGIYKALAAAPNNTLTYSDIGEAVFRALDLPFTEYTTREEVPTLATVRRDYEQTLQLFLFYRAVADLRRSWRIVLPNLEQCGLLQIGYRDLAEIARQDHFWSDLSIVRELSHEEREEFLATVLDFFRLEFAIHSENFLTPSRLKENALRFRERLKAPWTLDAKEELREPCVIRLDPLHRAARLVSKSMGSASALGKFIKHTAKLRNISIDDVRGDGYRDFILRLMDKLDDADYLYRQTARSETNEEVPVYRLRIEKLVWQMGDGETVKADQIKRRAYKDQVPRPNKFFREMYRRDFAPAKSLRAEDHTGHVKSEDRAERERRFRADFYLDEGRTQLDVAAIKSKSISALFCSPTMELGIDIGGLSVVHLRNAPPNASNYAQRSGRAGRNGQGALIFTYCSSYSPHDRHYFEKQADLVAGIVQAPRIDLCNRELLQTHLNAVAISEIGMPGLDSPGRPAQSLMNLVVDDNGEMPLSPGVRDGLVLTAKAFTDIKTIFRKVVADFETQLLERGGAWYSEEWIDLGLSKLADNLDTAMTRWRRLYRSARVLLTRATQPIESGRLSVGSDEYKKHKRTQDQANRQLNLLRNDVLKNGEHSEFSPYRYLADEGFIPGYNFTRLPIRIFIPSGSTTGDFISRPRPIALREYGPLNVIYHGGRKYKVSQLVTQDAESSLTEAKISTKAGYFLTGEQKDLEICPFSGVSLADNANKEHLHDLLEMSESRAEEIDRISCEEEERNSKGFDLQTYFSVDGGQFDRIRKAVVYSTETRLLNLRFMQAARLVHVNSKWRARPTEGFPLGLTSGDWRNSLPTEDQNLRENFRLVKLFTSNLADALYIEPVPGLGLRREGVITLQYALKRAVELVFQVEPNEIGVVTMGNPEAPNILLYEAAEGSLGILSQFVDNVDTFHKVIAACKTICRFDDPDYKAPASYDDLLSYYNQRDHKLIDRFLIRDALDKLTITEIEIQTNQSYADYDEHYQSLQRHIDPNSSTERAFIKYLYENGLRLPDAAQKRVDGIYCQPDFYYEPRFWVFCDGSPHDQEEVRARDEEQRQLIIAKGDEVWAWHYREDLAAKVAQRSDIFRKVR